MPTCIKQSNFKSDTSQEKFRPFNRYFDSVYKSFDNTVEALKPVFDRQSANANFNKLEVTETLLIRELAKLDVNKSVGPDGISVSLTDAILHRV